MLLQLDASPHDWLEGRGPRLSLVGAIDDATSMVPWGIFRDQEDAHGYFELRQAVTVRHGVPMAVYSDRHSIFWMTKNKELSVEEQLAGRRRPTQFGRLLQELGVEHILAHSPQAKGQAERMWETFQDRLTSELRLAGATTKLEAQDILVGMLPRHNRRFAVPAFDADPAWVPWPDDRRLAECSPKTLPTPSGWEVTPARPMSRRHSRPPSPAPPGRPDRGSLKPVTLGDAEPSWVTKSLSHRHDGIAAAT